MTIRFSGVGKWRGEWGVKRGESAAPDRLPEEEESRVADRAGPPVSEGEAAGQAGPEGGGREVGHGWAKR
jgi:hypothetical protein